jgi:YidC/Oxa1 family membrane protein insertase
MSRTMNLTMPLFMGWIAYSYSSGLALYFLISNLIYIAQYAMMGRVNWANLLPGKKETLNQPAKTTAKPANGGNKSTKGTKSSQRSK